MEILRMLGMVAASLVLVILAAGGVVYLDSSTQESTRLHTAAAVDSTVTPDEHKEIQPHEEAPRYRGIIGALFGQSTASQEAQPSVSNGTSSEPPAAETEANVTATDTEEGSSEALVEPEPIPISYTLPYTTSRFGMWTTTWGISRLIDGGVLDVRPAPESHGAEALLPGGDAWINYRYNAHVTISNGGVMLIARYDPNGDFVACNFWKNEITLLHHKNGETVTIDSKVLDDYSDAHYFEKDTWLSIRVQGNTVGCTLTGGGSDNLIKTISDMPVHGGIGIQTWYDDAPGAVSLQLREVKVEKL